MIELSGVQLGKTWTGSLSSSTGKAFGRINGYAWHFQSKDRYWMVEIADDLTLDATDLPLVGFGCAGWIHQSDTVLDEALFSNDEDLSEAVVERLNDIFEQFSQKTLKYLPAVTCACSE